MDDFEQQGAICRFAAWRLMPGNVCGKTIRKIAG